MSEDTKSGHFLSEVNTKPSLLKSAQSPELAERHAGLARFFYRYSTPIEAEIRMFSPWAAREVEDLASEFKVRIIEKNLIDSYDHEHGRFRDWLKRCLKNFLMDKYRERVALKRGVNIAHVSADDVDEDGNQLLQLVDRSELQGSAFDRSWARQVLRNCIASLGQTMAAEHKQRLFKELRPIFEGQERVEGYTVISARLGMSENAFKSTVSRQRERLAELIREEVRASMGSKAEIEDELQYLMDLLSKPAA